MSLPSHSFRSNHTETGVVLPIALIMLVILTFAGLMAARKSSTFEQFSNNMRTNQVARQSAEDGLRYCERVVMDKVDNESTTFTSTVTDKIVATKLSDETAISIKSGDWNKAINWATGATSLIELDDYAKDKKPSCIIQAMEPNRYLVTARGISQDAVVDESGVLTSGSEVWLQSILIPQVPLTAASGGPQ